MIEPYEMEHQPTEEDLCWLNENIDGGYRLIEKHLHNMVETATFIIFQKESDAVAFKVYTL